MESRLSVVFDILAAQVKNRAGVFVEGPICGASMIASSSNSLETGASPDAHGVVEEPYTKSWEFFSPCYFWDHEKEVARVVTCNLKAIVNSTHEPRRLVPFLARRGQSNGEYLLSLKGSKIRGSQNVEGATGDSRLKSQGKIAKSLILEKIYCSIIEKVGLTYLQTALDAMVSPYANECIRLKRLALEEVRPESPKMYFKGHKVSS
jgi:hypothetical protein